MCHDRQQSLRSVYPARLPISAPLWPPQLHQRKPRHVQVLDLTQDIRQREPCVLKRERVQWRAPLIGYSLTGRPGQIRQKHREGSARPPTALVSHQAVANVQPGFTCPGVNVVRGNASYDLFAPRIFCQKHRVSSCVHTGKRTCTPSTRRGQTLLIAGRLTRKPRASIKMISRHRGIEELRETCGKRGTRIR